MKLLRILIGLVVVIGVAAFAYVWFSGGSGDPTTAVTAPPVTTPPTTEPDREAPETVSTAEADSGAGTTTSATSADSGAGTTATSTPVSTGADFSDGGEVVYRIDSASSSVRFEIDELLNGNPKRVIGVTDEVAGEVLINFDDPTASRLGTVVINVRTLETDSSFRDRAMRGPILGSSRDENEFASFEPTSVEGLPEEAGIGDTVMLVVTGDLTLSGVTRSVVFDIEVMLVSEDRIEVTGYATVLRSDFGLSIPSVPSVSDVSDEILLAVDLVAFSTGG